MLLQPKLNLRVTQRQVLTPSLVQMVGLLALNKLELREMINAEIVENPVLEEVDETAPPMEEVSAREAAMDRTAEEHVAASDAEAKKDPFDEIDFGSYFQEYLDPGFRTGGSFEEIDKPSFENFLSQPSTLSDHLLWQVGSLVLDSDVLMAAEIIVGNLNDDGYLICSEEDLAGQLQPALGSGVSGAQALNAVRKALDVVQGLDPAGVAARDLRECLLLQIRQQRREAEIVLDRMHAAHESEAQEDSCEDPIDGCMPPAEPIRDRSMDIFATAEQIVRQHLLLLQRHDARELGRACGSSLEQAQAAGDYIRRLDPRPGQRYNQGETRLIEPDVAFVKREDEFVVVVNEDDMPALRLNHGYRRMLREKGTERDVREYVKERYRSAIQLLRNIEQRKKTIVRTCESIVRRQQEFLERGVEALRPMMIKDVAEEIGVHPSTVSRAVAGKFVHTTQGVYELRFFFSEGGNGPEGVIGTTVICAR